jgi:hypothetical protein
MHQELAMAKREIALGKLRAGDISTITDLCRRILMPMLCKVISLLPQLTDHS